MAFGSFSVSLKYTRPGPGMLCFRRAWEFGWLLKFGLAMCGGYGDGFHLVD